MSVFICQWIVYFLCIRASAGLYEDQVGKFEWRQQYVGKLKFAHLDVASPIKKVIVVTEQNVVAALSLKSGDIIWRKILESEENGNINLLSVNKEILTVSGNSNPLVRGWELEHGYLLWEWRVIPLNEFTKWMSVGHKLVQIDFHSSSHIQATSYHPSTGRKFKSLTIPATWLKPENCVIQNDVIACVDIGKVLYSIKLIDKGDELEVKVHHRSLLDLFQQEVTGNMKVTVGKLPIVSLKVGNTERPILLQPEIQVLKSDEESAQLFVSLSVDQENIMSSIILKEETLHITTRNLEGEILPDLSNNILYPKSHGRPDFGLMYCHLRKDRAIACRLLISTSHCVISLIQHPGKILWSREESLSSILTVEMVDLPVSDTDAAIEKEFDNKNSLPDFGASCGVFGMFFRRVVSQTFQLQNLILSVLGLRGSSPVTENEAMIQDEFGFHKIIVAATKSGKIYGIDNISGKIVWQIKLDNVEPLFIDTAKPVIPLYLLRNARHFPLPAKCVILVKDKSSGETLLVEFDPIEGIVSIVERPMPSTVKVKQSALLHAADENFSKGIILLDEKNEAYIYPPSAKSVALSNPSTIFMYSADASSGVLEGYSFSLSTKYLASTKTWRICLGSPIIAVVGKNINEKVHSQGRVLGDRSVLYKYINPNLVVVVTKSDHSSYKTIINLHLIDVVSGNIIYSASHRRAKEPVHVVHSENWVVYTYFNEKYRRTELAALEMYEGKTQINATAFSSFDSAILLPIVERQAYILPANVLALKETITEKGITSKHILGVHLSRYGFLDTKLKECKSSVLFGILRQCFFNFLGDSNVALSTGGILELPWIYVDPRRPMTVTAEMREEGVIPYMPEIPIPLEGIINHNQSVLDIRGIYTSSSGLESTCLVFVYGLDIFYTRVAPSKTFDLLKDDFDYYLITLVLLALTVVSYVTKRLASRKALKQAWK